MTATVRCSLIACAIALTARGAVAGPQASAPPGEVSLESRHDAGSDTASPAQKGGTSVEERARSAFDAGVQALGAQQWAKAEAHFRQSLALIRRPSTLYDLAVALYMQHRPRECISVLDELLSQTQAASDTRYQSQASRLRERARAELSTLRFVVTPPSAEVRIDGELVTGNGAEHSLDVDPGRHEVEVLAPGYVTRRLVFVTQEKTDLERAVSLKLALPARPNPRPAVLDRSGARLAARAGSSVTHRSGHLAERRAGYVAGALGLASLTGAGVLTLLSRHQKSIVDEHCPNYACDERGSEAVDKRADLLKAADAALAVGVLGGVLGAFLIWHSSRAQVGAQVGSSSVISSVSMVLP